jgi:hypothetical protein
VKKYLILAVIAIVLAIIISSFLLFSPIEAVKNFCPPAFSKGNISTESEFPQYTLSTADQARLDSYLSRLEIWEKKTPSGKKVSSIKFVLSKDRLQKHIFGADLKGGYDFASEESYKCSQLTIRVNLADKHLASEFRSGFYDQAMLYTVSRLTDPSEYNRLVESLLSKPIFKINVKN